MLGSIRCSSSPPLFDLSFAGAEAAFQTDRMLSTQGYPSLAESTEFTKSKNVIATVNGTAAIHVALQALGVKKNDEILMPSLNYIANVNASCYLGCIPHFIDVEKDTMGIDPGKLEKYLNNITFKKKNYIFNKKTKRKISGIIGVHLFGNSFNCFQFLK